MMPQLKETKRAANTVTAGRIAQKKVESLHTEAAGEAITFFSFWLSSAKIPPTQLNNAYGGELD